MLWCFYSAQPNGMKIKGKIIIAKYYTFPIPQSRIITQSSCSAAFNVVVVGVVEDGGDCRWIPAPQYEHAYGMAWGR